MRLFLLVSALALGFALAAPARAGDFKLGMLGDAHGEEETFRAALRHLRDRGATHILGMGDFVRWGGPDQLDRMLAMIEEVTGIPKERTFLLPGNWEHVTGHHPKRMNKVMMKYGRLVFRRYDAHGVVEIEGRKIFVSHFPVFATPDEFLPPPNFRVRHRSQAFFMDTIARDTPVPKDVDFAVFAHTHVAGVFYNAKSEIFVVNPGVLNRSTKAPREPMAASLYDSRTGLVHFVDVEKGANFNAVDIRGRARNPLVRCHMLLRNQSVLNFVP